MSAPEDTTVLYRPIGPGEYALLEANGFTAWPPRLPGQPFFYPVLTVQYAVQIASDWNVKESGAGYVTGFRVRNDFLARYERKVVGAHEHAEYWIPAEELPQLNEAMVGGIMVLGSYRRDEPADTLVFVARALRLEAGAEHRRLFVAGEVRWNAPDEGRVRRLMDRRDAHLHTTLPAMREGSARQEETVGEDGWWTIVLRAPEGRTIGELRHVLATIPFDTSSKEADFAGAILPLFLFGTRVGELRVFR